MISLVFNENMKIYRRFVPWLLLGFVVVINFVMSLIIYHVGDFEIHHVYDFMEVSSHLTTLLTLFSIVIAGSIVAKEFSTGTIKVLLVCPVSRSKILLSKYIATVLYFVLLMGVLLTCSFAFGHLFFGADKETGKMLTHILISYGNHAIETLVMVTITFMISTVSRSQVLAILMSFLLVIFQNQILGILSSIQSDKGKYVVFTNMDLLQYSENRTPFFSGTSLEFSITVLVIYFILFYLITFLVFNKKDVSV